MRGRTAKTHLSIQYVLIVMITSMSCHHSTGEHSGVRAAAQTRIANIRAFARLYGVVRWFHPSDAAAAIDWDRFAAEGVARVLDASSSKVLRTTLINLFSPVAPTAHIVANGEPFPSGDARGTASSGSDLVSWAHRGYGDNFLTNLDGVYASKRRHRDRRVALPGVPFVALWQAVDAVPFRGARIRLRGKLRTASHAPGQLWLRVDRGDATAFFDNMEERPVLSPVWAPAEVIGTVDPDATRIVFGIVRDGPGTTWYDDIELARQGADGAWVVVDIHDQGFETEDPMASWRPGTGRSKAGSIEGWKVTRDVNQAASGRASLRIEPSTQVLTDELFADAPRAGEAVEIDLGSGLRARIPIALYSKNGRTIGDEPDIARRTQREPQAVAPPGFDTLTGVADVVVAWNVLQHFWPYWDVVAVDWNAQLDVAIADALDDRGADDHVATLKRLSAAAPDGHASTTCRGETPLVGPPFSVDLLDGQIVVTATADKAISRGDVIVSVNGQPALELLAANEALASGSPQWRRVVACRQLGAGPDGSALALRVRRGGVELDVEVKRAGTAVPDFAHPSIERFADGVYYVDLGRATMAEIDAIMMPLATAPGVVFDVRSRPNSTRDVLSHLTTKSIDFEEGMTVAHVIRPDHAPTSMPTWEKHGRVMPPRQPQIAGRVAFLTGPRAISAAETVMSLVERHRLGAIIGGATAGTNGDIAGMIGPSGCRTTFTGLRVTRHDGSPYHLIGVLPTILATRTIAGVVAGRDEVLETGLAYVRSSSK